MYYLWRRGFHHRPSAHAKEVPLSSPLYATTVLDVQGATARLDIISVCTAGCFTVSRLFALAVLQEPLFQHVMARPGIAWPHPVDGPLRTAFAENAVMDWCSLGVPAAEQFRLSLVADIAYEDFRNVPPLPFPPEADGRYRAVTAPAAFRSAVNNQRDAPLAQALRPAAILRVEVTHPRWLSHLVRGMMWDSYVFDEHGPVIF